MHNLKTQVSNIAGRILYCLSHQGSPKNTGVGSQSLLQGIFLTQGLNPGLPHYRQILYLSHQGSPNLETTNVKLSTLFYITLFANTNSGS